MDFEFLKNFIVDSIDKVLEQFCGFYGEGEGGYVLQDSFKGIVIVVDGLNKFLKVVCCDVDEVKCNCLDVLGFVQIGQLFGIEGDDVMNVEILCVGVEKLILELKDGKVNWDKMKQSLESGFNIKLQVKDVEIQGMGKFLQKYLVIFVVVQVIVVYKGVLDLLLLYIIVCIKVVKDGEDYVVCVVDDLGDLCGNVLGGFMMVEDLVKEFKGYQIFGWVFESEVFNGGGKLLGFGNQKFVQCQGELIFNQKIVVGFVKCCQ